MLLKNLSVCLYVFFVSFSLSAEQHIMSFWLQKNRRARLTINKTLETAKEKTVPTPPCWKINLDASQKKIIIRCKIILAQL
jgi:hypothetical protein